MHVRWMAEGEGTVGAVEIDTPADRDIGNLASEVTKISDGYLDLAIRCRCAGRERKWMGRDLERASPHGEPCELAWRETEAGMAVGPHHQRGRIAALTAHLLHAIGS